ncbi:multiheme c-type cytochrome [Candidatus Magnetominusculus dajiuhuensis]|uniref:multiheme c-type cytochrome n=1 Tax=Candidatus Magnetominusculus dajiuhuensis TaxID=3137712 RepID=UPI003B43C37F
MFIRYIMVFMLAAVAVSPAILAAHDFPEGAVPYEKSRRCSACHPAVYKEWAGSLHSQSSVHKDAAHRAMYGAFLDDMKSEGKEGSYHCATCHTPMADNVKELVDGTAKPNENLWREDEGVGCAFCHRVDTVVEGKDRNTFTINKDGAYISSNPVEKAPHGVGVSQLFASGEICMGCHSHLENQDSVAICSMKEEGQGNCIACHMERKEGPPSTESAKETHASHEMAGGHSLVMLCRAVSVNVKINKTDNSTTVDVEITNKTSHDFPSTMPMRMAFLKVAAFDADKKAVFRNYQVNPMEDRKAVFMKAFRGGGDVGVPAWKAQEVALDTRLKSAETRKFSYPIPNDGVKSVSVEIIYRLFPSQALEKYRALKDADDKSIDTNFTLYKKDFPF